MRTPILPILALLVSTPAAFAGVADGAAMAERWCASCHAVTPDQPMRSDGVPSFAEIAGRRDDDALKAFLLDPHPPMGDVPLSRREIVDLTAYIRAQEK